MLFTCIRTEFLKLKRSFVWLACFIIPVIPAIMGTANYVGNLAILTGKWYALWTQHTLFYACFFFAPLISVYCAYLWRVENFGHNRNVLMTAPVPLSCIFFGKLSVTFLVTVVTQLWMFFLFTVSGRLVGLPGLPPLQILGWCLRATLGGLVCAAAMLLLAMCIRSFALPIGLSLVLTLIGFLFSNKGWGLFYPFSLIASGMNANTYDDKLTGNMLPFFASCIIYLALFSGAAIHLLRTRDVRA